VYGHVLAAFRYGREDLGRTAQLLEILMLKISKIGLFFIHFYFYFVKVPVPVRYEFECTVTGINWNKFLISKVLIIFSLFT
jgi:hypothetical protein